MLLNNWKSEDSEYLERFYGEGQDWNWGEISSLTPNSMGKVADWITNLPPPRKHPLILPVRRTENNFSSWVAIAFSESQCEELRELLNAFIGKSCSNYSGVRSRVSVDDPISLVSADWSGGDRFFEFHPTPSDTPEQRKRVETSLKRMLDVIRLRPDQRTAKIRTTEGLLREFRAALLTQDQASAERLISEIRQTGRLSAENLRFLRIELFGAFGQWREMRLSSEWQLILNLRRPKRITALMIEALWHDQFRELVQAKSEKDALEWMRDKVLPTHRSLFKSHGIPLKPSCATTFLLAAVADSPQRVEQIPTLLSLVPSDSENRPFAEAIANSEKEPKKEPVEDPFSEIELCMRREDLDTAWTLLLNAPEGISRCKFMLECAFEFLTSETATEVEESLKKLDPDKLKELLSSRRNERNWEDVKKLIHSTENPETWEDWLSLLGSPDADQEILGLAQSESANWNVSDYLNRPARISVISEKIEQAACSTNENILRRTLPYLGSFFLPDSVPDSSFRDIYLSILSVISLSDQISSEDWATAESMSCAVLEAAPSKENYGIMVEALEAIWKERGELVRLGWALDQLDLLITGPNLDEGRRSAFFESVRDYLFKNARRVESGQKSVFALLCGDLNRRQDFEAIPWPQEDDAEITDQISVESLISERLEGKSVGIYTLNEKAATRAAEIIEKNYENVTVRLSHDHGGSDKLKVIAQDSDYLIVVTQSAKHAATNFIKDKRSPKMSDLIYPKGRGTASLMEALRGAVAST